MVNVCAGRRLPDRPPSSWLQILLWAQLILCNGVKWIMVCRAMRTF